MSGATRTAGRRRPRVARVGEVLLSSWLTQHVVRVVLGGDGPSGFPAGEFTDHCVELLFPPPGALPAIGVALWRLPAGVPALVFVEVAGPEEEKPDLVLHPGAELRGVHRGAAVPGEALLVEDLRLHLRAERGLDRSSRRSPGCWRLGRSEDRWRAEKRDRNAEVEAAEQALAG